MSLPSVTINVLNGQLGAVAPIADGVAGMVLSSSVAPADLAFAKAVKINSLAEAETKGITAAWQTANNTLAHTHIKEFYDTAGNGAPLWIMIVIDTETMEQIADKAGTNKYAKKLLDDAGGEIRLLGISRKPDAGYSALKTKGLDDDAYNAAVKLNTLALDYEAAYAPFVGLIDGRDYQGVIGTLVDLREATFNKVAVVLASAGTTGKSAGVGLCLGAIARLPVQRNIGRVKNGALPITAAELTNETAIEDATGLDTIHDKGFIIIRTYAGRTGYYYADDPVATLLTDDYSSVGRRRVINKAIQIAYNVYVNEINEEIEINADGQMNPAIVKSLQGAVENAVNLLMTSQGEISSVRCAIDPAQNVLSTNKVEIDLFVTPVGYAKEIVVNIGFDNPSLIS